MAAADLLGEDFGVAADVWSVPSFTELRRDGLAAERWNMLHPERGAAAAATSSSLAGRPAGPVVAATDYMRAFAEQIRPFVPAPVQGAGHRRLRPLGLPPRAAPLLRGRPPPRRARRADRAGRRRRGAGDRGGRRDRPIRHRPRQARTRRGSDSSGSARRHDGHDDRVPRSRFPTSATSPTCRSSRCTSTPGDKVNAEDPLVTLESDKATMDVPAPVGRHGRRGAGQGRRRGQRGHADPAAGPGDGARTTPPSLVEQQEPRAAARPAGRRRRRAAVGAPLAAPRRGHGGADGDRRRPGRTPGPSVRRMARELGSTCRRCTASGPKGRITKDDLLRVPEGTARRAGGGAGARRRGRGSRRSRRRTSPSSGRSRRAAVADQEDVGPVPAPVVAQRPARHPQRRGGHHRAGRLPQAARHRGQGRGTPTGSRCWRSWSRPWSPRCKEFPEFNSSLTPEKDAIILKRTTTSASPWTPPAGWSSRWSRTPTARASSS